MNSNGRRNTSTGESCDGYAKAPFRSMWASTVAVAGPASGSTAGELSAVLGIDCGRRSTEDAALDAGVSPAVGGRWFRRAGGMPPFHFSQSSKPLSGRYLSFAEREEIAILRVQEHGVRAIARKLGRAPSTISRELRRNAATRGGGLEYRATTAQWHADRSLRRPKPAKLA